MSISQCKENLNISFIDVSTSTLTLEDFETLYLKANQPVLIKHELKKLPCSKWTIDYLLKIVGNNQVTVRGKTNLQTYKVC